MRFLAWLGWSILINPPQQHREAVTLKRVLTSLQLFRSSYKSVVVQSCCPGSADCAALLVFCMHFLFKQYKHIFKCVFLSDVVADHFGGIATRDYSLQLSLFPELHLNLQIKTREWYCEGVDRWHWCVQQGVWGCTTTKIFIGVCCSSWG